MDAAAPLLTNGANMAKINSVNDTDAGGNENMAIPTLEERTSRMEGAYDHLATKADVERVRTEVERLRADFARWLFQLGVALIGAIGVAVAILKLT